MIVLCQRHQLEGKISGSLGLQTARGHQLTYQMFGQHVAGVSILPKSDAFDLLPDMIWSLRRPAYASASACGCSIGNAPQKDARLRSGPNSA